MAPPATKRRKLEHSDSEEDSEESFAGFDEVDSSTPSESNAELDGEDGSDTAMNGFESFEGNDDLEEDLEDDEDMDDEVEPEEKQSEPSQDARRTAERPKAPKRSAAALQDGVYTAETFKSNIFKLQVDDLLDQVKLKYGKKEAPAENAMRSLKAIIEQIPNRDPVSVIEAEKAVSTSGIAIPFPTPRPPKDAQYKLQYERPASINATGSYPLKTATKSDEGFAIDLVVVMPKAILQDKDYLNHRYFYKRAYYLACLAAGIKQQKQHKFKLSFDTLNGNQLQPVLLVQPNGKGDTDDFTVSKCCIRILVALPENNFPQNKLLPGSNCIRPKEVEGEAPKQTLRPTPFYNATLQSDANVTAYLRLIHGVGSKADAYRDACILGRIWMKQRGFGSSIRQGGFGNFEWTTLMALLLQPNSGAGVQSLSPGYSSYQLFKATLQFLTRHDLSKKPFIFQAHDVTVPKAEHAPVFFDGPRGQNILFKMTQWSYARLQLEAKATIDMLGDSVFDHFNATFILKTELPRMKYDAILEIPIRTLELDFQSKAPEQVLNEACRTIYNILTRAMTDRVTNISFIVPEGQPWSISSQPTESHVKRILVNIATNPANASRTVDHGPSAENKIEAAAFRKFWGEKSELRRFKDGSILESLVWPTKDASTSVVEQIALYILGRHLNLRVANESKFASDEFALLIPFGRIQGSSGVTPFLPIMNAFSSMEKDIRDLEDLPLQLRHLRAADPMLRYTSTELPTPGSRPASVVLQFEGSGRWPDDLCAIQRTKIAFLLKLGELLSKSNSKYTANVGLENPSQPAQNQAYLDIITPAGFTFRVRIYHDREVTLFDRQLKDKTLDGPSRESAANSLALYKQQFVQSPLHSQVVQTLCTRFLALSPSIRLLKHWFATHMLAPHFEPELIELLAIKTFLQPHPWAVPSNATTAFLRTLAWISRWDWRSSPLVVDFSSNFINNPAELEDPTSKTMKPEDLERIQTRFEAWRRIDPAMNRVVLFAATNLDEEGTTWTDKSKPEKVVASRLTALARAATQVGRADNDHLLRWISSDNDIESKNHLTPEALFSANTNDYDIVMSINPKYALKSSKLRKSGIQFKNLEIQQQSSRKNAGDAPLPELFAQELLDIYGDSVLWFWDPETLDEIVGLWNPIVTGQRSWKVKAGWNSEPVRSKKTTSEGKNKDVDVRINKAAIVHEIVRLGGELIGDVAVKP